MGDAFDMIDQRGRRIRVLRRRHDDGVEPLLTLMPEDRAAAHAVATQQHQRIVQDMKYSHGQMPRRLSGLMGTAAR